jgi:hypothetical protein
MVVMAALVAAIHVLLCGLKAVDGRHEAGHDVERAGARQFAVWHLKLAPLPQRRYVETFRSLRLAV